MNDEMVFFQITFIFYTIQIFSSTVFISVFVVAKEQSSMIA